MAQESEPEIVVARPVRTAVVCARVPMADLAGFFDDAFTRVGAVLTEQGVTPTTPALALYHGMPGAEVDLEVGFGTDHAVRAQDGVTAGELPGGRVARLLHTGPYDGLGESWRRLAAWMNAQGVSPSGTMWEVYLTEPTPESDPDDLHTELTWPLVQA